LLQIRKPEMIASAGFELVSASVCRAQGFGASRPGEGTKLALLREDRPVFPFPLFRLRIGRSRFFGRLDEARLLQIRNW
jgi:hypothetical protein